MSRAMWRKKRRRKKIKLGTKHLVIAAAMVMVVASLAIFFTDSFGIASSLRQVFAAGSTEIEDAEGMEVIDGDYTIDSPGTRLEDVHITGDLRLTSGIGDGEVDLVNVTVEGAVLVQGGGVKSIFMLNCDFGEVKVNRPDGRVRLVASGETVVDQVSLETGTRLVENLSEGADGVRSVEVKTNEKIELAGEFEAVSVVVEDATVDIDGETLEHLKVAGTASGSAVSYPDGFIINNMRLQGATLLYGHAEINQAIISASGVSELEGSFKQARITAEAGKFDLISGSHFEELDVAKDALNNVFNLGEDVIIDYLVLNEAITMQGKGKIASVLVNAAGSTLEQIPADIEFGREVSIMIDGHEISTPQMLADLLEHGDPQYASTDQAATVTEEATSEPEPQIEPEPEPDPEPVEEDPEPDRDQEEQEEPEADPDEDEREATGGDAEDGVEAMPDFALDIVVPTQEERDRLSLHGKNLVYVSLQTDNPENYMVEITDLEIRYLDDVRLFYGIVDENTGESDLMGEVTVRPRND